MVKNLKPRVIYSQHVAFSGGIYPKQALQEDLLSSTYSTLRTLCGFLTGLLQSAVAQLITDPEIRTRFHFLDEQFKGLERDDLGARQRATAPRCP